jgi:hypothetical protein
MIQRPALGTDQGRDLAAAGTSLGQRNVSAFLCPPWCRHYQWRRFVGHGNSICGGRYLNRWRSVMVRPEQLREPRMLMAIRRASSCVSTFACRAGFVLPRVEVLDRLPVGVSDDIAAGNLVGGAGKRRSFTDVASR